MVGVTVNLEQSLLLLVPHIPGSVSALIAGKVDSLLQILLFQGITDPRSGGWSLISIADGASADGASTDAGCASVSTRLLGNL